MTDLQITLPWTAGWGDFPGLAPRPVCTFERLREVSNLHPERRHLALRPTDRDFDFLNQYLSLHPERRGDFLDRAIRDGRVVSVKDGFPP